MKDKIIYLILGILIGAVITAGCFLVFSHNNQNEMRRNGEGRENMSNRIRGERPNDIPVDMPSTMGNNEI